MMTTSARRSASATLDLRLRLAAQLGWHGTCLDPDTGWLWRIERGDRALLLAGSLSPLNDAVAARLSADKFHCATVLAAAGIPVPPTARCLRPGAYASGSDLDDRYADQRGVEPGLRVAADRGYPLVIKPNRGSRGHAVTRVDDRAGLLDAITRVWALDELALVQPALPGLDLRVDLLDGELLLAYLRRPLRLLGDGRATVLALLERADARAQPGSRFWDTLQAEPLWTQTLAAAGVDGSSVLDEGLALEFPSTVLNLNRCCTVELFATLPASWMALARRIAAAIGLRHCGLDLRLPASVDPFADPLAQDPASAVVLETNASPGVAQIHAIGPRGAELAEAAERRVLEAMLDGR